MKGRSWKVVGVIVGVAVLAVLLGLTVHLVSSARAANRDLAALRNEVAQQQRENATKQTDSLSPISAQITDLSNKVKQQAQEIADVSNLSDRVSRLEEEAQDAARPPVVTPSQPAEPSSTAQPAGTIQPPMAPQSPASTTKPTQTAPAALSPLAAPQTPATALESEAAPEEVSMSSSSQGKSIDAGRFVILQAGTQIGAEDFDLSDTGSGYVLSSTLRESDGLQGTELVEKTTLNGSFLPTRYELRGTKDGSKVDIAVEVVNKQAVAISLGGRILEDNVQSESLVAVVDPALPSFCVVIQRSLAASLGDQPVELSVLSGEAPAFVPLRLEPGNQVTVSDTSTPDAGLLYEMTLSGETVQYYVHGDRVVGFAIPSREVFAYRSDIYPKGLFVFPRTLVELGMPAGIREEDFTLVSQGVKLVGTFTAPTSAAAKMPALLLIPDIGPYDRDGTKVGLEAQILRDIARRFAQQGIASYRYDPRGIGASEGDYGSVTLANAESDALLALLWLRANPMLDPDQIYFVGYGYGGLVALHLGANGMAHGVATLALPASSYAVTWVNSLRSRAAADGRGAEEIAALIDREQAFLSFVRGTKGTWTDIDLTAAHASLAWMNEAEYAKRTGTPFPLLRDVLDLNPLDAVKNVKTKLFILEGTKDFDVPSSDADLLAQAAKDAGNQDVTTNVVQDVNHLLRLQSEDITSLYRHLDEEVDWSVLQPLLSWMGGPVMPTGGMGGPSPSS